MSGIMPDDELDQIKKLVNQPDAETDDPGFTAEEILSEFRPGPPEVKPEPEEPILLFDDTLAGFDKQTQQLDAMAREAESKRSGKPESPPEPPDLREFSLGADFDSHFAPSREYGSDEAEPDMPKNDLRQTLARWLERMRKPEETPALTLQQAQARAQNYARNIRIRLLLAFAFLIPLVIISCTQTWGILPRFLTYNADGKPYVTLFFMVLLQLLVMLCGIDVLARGISSLIHLRPGAETLVALSCFASLMQVGSIVLRNTEAESGVLSQTVGFLPYCAVAAATVAFAMWGEMNRQTALARTYKTAAMPGEPCDCVINEEKLWGGLPGFSRRPAEPSDFAAQTETPDVAARVTRFFTPLLMAACIVLSVLAASYHPEGQYFFWAFAALCCAGVPLTTFGAYSLVFSRISSRLSHMGAAITGWQGALEMSRGDILVIEDNDLFPPGTLALNGLKILGDHSFESIISLSASLLHASGSGLFKALESVVKDQPGYLRAVTGLESFEGGCSGNIDGDRIMVGTLNFMHSMGIQVPPEFSSKSAVFISLNHDLAGALAIAYTPASQVKGALLLLEQQKLTNVLAVRDINITPTLLRDKFGINPDLPEFPVVEERVALSDPHRPYHGKVSAVLAREGLCPYAEAVVGGQRLHRFTIINLCVHLISLLLGLLLVFYFTCQTQPAAATAITPGNLLIFMFIWWAAQWLISCFVHRY